MEIGNNEEGEIFFCLFTLRYDVDLTAWDKLNVYVKYKLFSTTLQRRGCFDSDSPCQDWTSCLMDSIQSFWRYFSHFQMKCYECDILLRYGRRLKRR